MSETNFLFDKHAKITCCSQCTERQIGCHSNCKNYLEQRNKRNEMQEKKHQQKKKNEMLNEIDSKRDDRMKKNKKQKRIQKIKNFS